MSRIVNTRPVNPRRAIMTEKQERDYMNTFKGGVCEACGINDGTIVPAHMNMGLGGTGYRAKGIVGGLCVRCHDLLDRRVIDEKARTQVLEKLAQKLLRDRAIAFVNTSLNETENGDG